MAAQILVAGSTAREMNTWAVAADPCLGDEPEGLSCGQVVAAFWVLLTAVILLAAPALVALVAIMNPAGLARISDGLIGASAALTLVAAGRVPAAAFVAFVVARSDRRP